MPVLSIRGVLVDFPFEPYDVQLAYMDRVIQALQEGSHALLESPTGTGKTLCLLCAVLAWRQAYDGERAAKRRAEEGRRRRIALSGGAAAAAPPKRGPTRIIYSSRTHGQITQVIKELKKTSYKPNIAILGSRAQMCIHPKVSEEKGTRQNHKCRQLASKRRCKFYNNAERLARGKPTPMGVMDIEDLVEMGRSEDVCPYFFSRSSVQTAGLILMPYNYLVDPKIRATLGNLNLEDAVVIFDEAHNLTQACAGALSFDLGGREVAGCIAEVQRCVNALKDPVHGGLSGAPGAGEVGDISQFLRLKEVFLNFEERVAEIQLPSADGYVSREGCAIFKLFEGVGITLSSKQPLLMVLDKAIDIVLGMDDGFVSRSCALQRFKEVINIVFPADASMDTLGDNLRFHRMVVRAKEDKKRRRGGGGKGGRRGGNFFGPQPRAATKGGPAGREKVVSFWCFDSGIVMQALLQQGVRTTLLTSGTLSPMDAVSYELKQPFPIRLENPHVVKEEQIWIGVVSRGPKNTSLNASYRNRGNRSYQEDLGGSLVNYCRVVPNGVLVFFPSYAALESMLSAWERVPPGAKTSVLDRIRAFKKVVVEPRASSQYAGAIAEYRESVHGDEKRNGAVLFAVCRGKSSEGMDFSGNQCRAVVVVGMPYPNLGDLRVKVKRRLLDSHGDVFRSLGLKPQTGNEWYMHQAACAVNQAIGRVIRHINDFGAVLLCDERFRRKDVRESLSHWLRPHVRTPTSFGQGLREITKFFKRAVELGLGPKPKKRLAISAARPSRRGALRAAERAAAELRRRRHPAPRALREDHRLLEGITNPQDMGAPSPAKADAPPSASSKPLSLMSALSQVRRIPQRRDESARSGKGPLKGSASAGYVPLTSRGSASATEPTLAQKLLERRRMRRKTSDQASSSGRTSAAKRKMQAHLPTAGSECLSKRPRNPMTDAGSVDVAAAAQKENSQDVSFLDAARAVLSGPDFKRLKLYLCELRELVDRDAGEDEMLAHWHAVQGRVRALFGDESKRDLRAQFKRLLPGPLQKTFMKAIPAGPAVSPAPVCVKTKSQRAGVSAAASTAFVKLVKARLSRPAYKSFLRGVRKLSGTRHVDDAKPILESLFRLFSPTEGGPASFDSGDSGVHLVELRSRLGSLIPSQFRKLYASLG